MEYFIVSLLNGAIYGLLLFMVSAGLTLIFGMMGVLNFAHASFYMLGAYTAYAAGRARLLARAGGLPIWSARPAWRSSASSCAACTASATRTNCC